MKTDPGLGVAAATWLATKSPILIGSDNWSVEVNPNPDLAIGSPVHQILLAVNGIHMPESLKLDELAAKQVYECAFVLQPLKLKGATGSTVAPIAIR
jgi:kynurenine formamidase